MHAPDAASHRNRATNQPRPPHRTMAGRHSLHQRDGSVRRKHRNPKGERNKPVVVCTRHHLIHRKPSQRKPDILSRSSTIGTLANLTMVWRALLSGAETLRCLHDINATQSTERRFTPFAQTRATLSSSGGSMSDANKQLVQRWFDEVWNQGNPATIDELLLPDGKAHGFPEPSAILTGPS